MTNIKIKKIISKLSLLSLIIFSFLVINSFKNIYIENSIKQKIDDYNIGKINCTGFFKLNCTLNNINSNKKILDNYKIDIDKIEIYNFDFLNKKEFIQNNLKVYFGNFKINDLNDSLDRLSKPINLKIDFTYNKQNHLKFILKHQDLNISLDLIFQNEIFYKKKNFLSLFILIDRKNDIIKEIVYELYKLKFLEKRKKDGVELARGVNRSLGVDTSEVIPKKVFLEEPYLILSMLIISEIETFDIVMEYNDDENISNFLRDILENNGKSRLEIKKRTNYE